MSHNNKAEFSTSDSCLSTPHGFGTAAVHVGSASDPITGAVVPPISLSSTFVHRKPGEHFAGFVYSRDGNPTRNGFEAAVAALEGGTHGIAFASGSAAIAMVIMSLPKGSHIVSVNDVYGGTFDTLTKLAPNMGYSASFANLAADPATVVSAMTPATKLIWLESPTNPTMKLVDISAVVSHARRVNPDVIIGVDNTFMSPYFQRPLALGADVVAHSATKYLNGHSDVCMGIAITSRADLAARLRGLQTALGAVPSPMDCYLAHRGLKTLHLRMQAHERNALVLAHALEFSPYVESVIYPGLKSHPQHALAKRQMSGFGGMLAFRIKGDLAMATAFFQHLKTVALAESLGGVESLAELPATMTHGNLPAEERAKHGITDNLVRVSVGVEDAEDIVGDVIQALENAFAAGKAR
ncbi:hypothetical protein GGF31_008451 [Allomyces arbusculus]|nr:hypothetical protein GGF31_008451 [Allomyces arbusculus]